jgi:PST family polysaccharide transporter
MGWLGLAHAGQNVLRLVSRLILARLLGPESFGWFALAMVFVAGVRLVCALPLPRLIQPPEPSPRLLAAAHWTSLALGAAGTVVLLGVADAFAALAGQPEMAPLLRGVSFTVILTSLSAVPRTWLARQLAFRRSAPRELLSEAVGTVAAVGAALGGAGAWSLVLGELVGEMLGVAVFWRSAPPHRSGPWTWSACRELVRVGLGRLGYDAAGFVRNQGDRFLVGRLFGAQTLGLYSVAVRLGEMATHAVTVVFAEVGAPSFAHLHDDPHRSRRGFLEALRGQAVLLTPPLLAMALLADAFVPLALGSAWIPAIPFIGVMMVRRFAAALLALPTAALLGRRRTDRLFVLGVVGLALSVLGWLMGLPWGALGVAVGATASTVLLVLVAMQLVAPDLRAGPADWARALAPAALGAGTMVLALLIAARALPPFLHGTVPGLLAGLVIAAAGYVLPLLPWLVREVPHYVLLVRGDATGGRTGAADHERPVD